MISKLRRKFIVISMVSVTAVLVMLIALINIFNYKEVIRNADEVLNILTANEGEFPPDTDPKTMWDGPGGPGPDGRGKDQMSPEMRFEARFFTIVFDKFSIASGHYLTPFVGIVQVCQIYSSSSNASFAIGSNETPSFEKVYVLPFLNVILSGESETEISRL